MKGIELTAFDLAQRFAGVRDIAGSASNPQILAMLRLDEKWSDGDGVSWRSAFVIHNGGLPRLRRPRPLPEVPGNTRKP